MKNNKNAYFSIGERILWLGSVLIILLSAVFSRVIVPLNIIASLIGVTSLIFIAKANPVGQALTVIFSLLYGIISLKEHYYGEMLTYIGMTMPMAVVSLVTWLRHPFKGNKSQVEVHRVKKSEIGVMILLTVAVTAVFYFILKYLNTASLVPSTVSVTTSFLAVFLTYLRSPYYALAYAANDVVLIVLWSLAAINNPECIAVICCFAAFLINDIYGFVSWRRLQKMQSDG